MQWLEPRPAKRLPIRLTPLIDVVFILLLFFMLSSRLDPMGLMELDTAVTPGAPEAFDEPLAELHLHDDGTLSWNGEAREPDAIRQSLADAGSSRVFVGTDSNVPLSEFTRWLSEVEAAGHEPAWRRGREG